jgi:hypothetical protein
MTDSGRQINDQYDPKWQMEKTYERIHSGYVVWSGNSAYTFPPTEQGRIDAVAKLNRLNKVNDKG